MLQVRATGIDREIDRTSIYDENHNLHTGGVIQHMGLFFHKAAYSRYDVDGV
jgi:hypothetical protein